MASLCLDMVTVPPNVCVSRLFHIEFHHMMLEMQTSSEQTTD